jgi:hypothetical protein
MEQSHSPAQVVRYRDLSLYLRGNRKNTGVVERVEGQWVWVRWGSDSYLTQEHERNIQEER